MDSKDPQNAPKGEDIFEEDKYHLQKRIHSGLYKIYNDDDHDDENTLP